MGTNVPRTWLEAAGLAVAAAALIAGAVTTARSGPRGRTLLAVLALGLVVPLAVALLGIEDRVYARNLLFLLPVAGMVAAPALVRARGVPLLVYAALAVVTSLWVYTNWRYEYPDWRGAVARTQAIDPRAAVVAVTPVSQPVAQDYLGRPEAQGTVLTRDAWIVVEPYRAAHHRALGPAPVPAAITATLRRFTTERALQLHGFTLILVTAPTNEPIVPTKLAGAALFPPP